MKWGLLRKQQAFRVSKKPPTVKTKVQTIGVSSSDKVCRHV